MADNQGTYVISESGDGELTQDIVGWDVRTWAKAVAFWERTLGTPGTPLRCLEVGAGPGGPSLLLALKGHDVICSNWQGTRAQAQPLHDKYPDATGIQYRDIDVTEIPFTEQFDLIVFKSVLGGLAPYGKSSRQAMREIHRALKPNGRLLFAENMRGTVFHRLARAIVYRLRKASWRFMPVSEMHEHLGGFARYELHTTGVVALFGITESQRRALAAVDSAVVNRISPVSWHYVAYGVATKAA